MIHTYIPTQLIDSVGIDVCDVGGAVGSGIDGTGGRSTHTPIPPQTRDKGRSDGQSETANIRVSITPTSVELTPPLPPMLPPMAQMSVPPMPQTSVLPQPSVLKDRSHHHHRCRPHRCASMLMPIVDDTVAPKGSPPHNEMEDNPAPDKGLEESSAASSESDGDPVQAFYRQGAYS